jgi:hypothetical protein
VGTEKRERQKANRAKRQAEEAKVARQSAVKRNIVRWVVIAIVAFGGLLLIAWIGGAFDGDEEEPEITVPELTIPDAVETTLPVTSEAPATTATP